MVGITASQAFCKTSKWLDTGGHRILQDCSQVDGGNRFSHPVAYAVCAIWLIILIVILLVRLGENPEGEGDDA